MWTPVSEPISCLFWQNVEHGNSTVVFEKLNGTHVFNWKIETTADQDLSASHNFFFQLYIDGATSPSATSHHINVTGDASDLSSDSASSEMSSATLMLTAATPATSSTAASTVASTAASTTSATPSSSSSPLASASSSEAGLSTGAKIGLGVGIPVAAIALLGAAGFFLYRGRSAKKADQYAAPPESGPTYAATTDWKAPIGQNEKAHEYYVYEADGAGPEPQESPGGLAPKPQEMDSRPRS